MKTLDFIYQSTQIHFALKNEGNIMVNATEMAKIFGKRIDHFLKANHTQNFINFLSTQEDLFPPNGGNKQEELSIPNGGDKIKELIIYSNNKEGTFMHEILALKFAAWLDVKFEVWVYKTIQNITFGNYKKHWEAHARQEEAKTLMETYKNEMLSNPNTESVIAYFEAQRVVKTAKAEKAKAIKNQLNMFN